MNHGLSRQGLSLFLLEQPSFKKLYIRAFIFIIDDLKVFLFRFVQLKTYIYGSFDLYGFKNGL